MGDLNTLSYQLNYLNLVTITLKYIEIEPKATNNKDMNKIYI